MIKKSASKIKSPELELSEKISLLKNNLENSNSSLVQKYLEDLLNRYESEKEQSQSEI